MQFVKRYDKTAGLINVPETTSPITHSDWSNLIMPPGVYEYNQKHYDLNTEGLYCFFNAQFGAERHIIYENDVRALMEAFNWLTVFGKADEQTDVVTLTNNPWYAITRKLALRCGPTVNFIQYSLNALNIESRQVSLLTAETPNNYVDGHVSLEVKIDGVWTLWDNANNRFFKDGTTGHHFNLDEMILSTNVAHENLADPASNNDLWGGFSADVYYDAECRTQNNMIAWVDRIYQIPGIWDADGKCYFYMPAGTESRQSYVEGLSTAYRVISYADWKARFYA